MKLVVTEMVNDKTAFAASMAGVEIVDGVITLSEFVGLPDMAAVISDFGIEIHGGTGDEKFYAIVNGFGTVLFTEGANKTVASFGWNDIATAATVVATANMLGGLIAIGESNER